MKIEQHIIIKTIVPETIKCYFKKQIIITTGSFSKVDRNVKHISEIQTMSHENQC